MNKLNVKTIHILPPLMLLIFFMYILVPLQWCLPKILLQGGLSSVQVAIQGIFLRTVLRPSNRKNKTQEGRPRVEHTWRKFSPSLYKGGDS